MLAVAVDGRRVEEGSPVQASPKVWAEPDDREKGQLRKDPAQRQSSKLVERK